MERAQEYVQAAEGDESFRTLEIRNLSATMATMHFTAALAKMKFAEGINTDCGID